MFYWPRAEFWRAWGVAAFLSVVACFILAPHARAAETGHHHHHHHRTCRHRARHRARFETKSTRAQERPVRGGADAVSIAMHYLGSGNPTGSRGPWCGDFMNMLEHLAGRSGIPSRMAIAWAHYGHASAPVRGAIAVFRGHVARVMARAGDRLQIISGNWGGRVGIGWVSARSAIAFRMP